MPATLSGFELINNQPIIFDLFTDPCRTILDDGYCQKFNRSDEVEVQLTRTPCGNSLACTSTTPNYGPDEVLNGDFSSGSNWVEGAGWLIGAGVAAHTPGSTDSIYQIIPTLILGATYRITYTVLNRTAGEVWCVLGDGAGSSQGTAQDADGTYSENLVNNDAADPDTLQFYCDTAFDGDIDNVSIERVYYCYEDIGWTFNTTTGFYTHLPGFNVALTAVAPPLTAGKWYFVTIFIENHTTGSVQINCGDNVSDAIGDKGEFTKTVASGTTTNFRIIPTSDFDGNVLIATIYELSEPTTLELVDATDLTTVCDLLPYSSLDGDRLNIKFSLAQLLADGAIPGNVSEGCYRIKIDSQCAPVGGNMVTNGQFIGGAGYVIDDWTPLTDFSMVDFTFADAQFDRSLATQTFQPTIRNTTNPAMTAGNYQAVFRITKNTDELAIGARISLDGVNWSSIFYTIDLHTFQFDNYIPGLGAPANNQCVLVQAVFNADGSPNLGQIVIDNVRVFKLSSDYQPLYSNCFKIKGEWECTKLLEAYSDCESHGFDFRNFKLRIRVPFLYFNAEYPMKDNTYVYSSGDNKRTGSERDKVYFAKVDKVDEISHDTISVMLLQSTFKVDSKEFFFKGKAYTILPDKLGRFSTYRAQFQLSEKNSVVFGYACGDCAPLTSSLSCPSLCEMFIGEYETATDIPGWYYTANENLLTYYDGAEWTGLTKSCEGFIQSFDSTKMLIWNEANGTWLTFISIETLVATTPTTTTLTGIIPAGCAAQVQISTNEGGEWADASVFFTQPQLLAGVVFDTPVDPWWVILKVRCGACEYFSPINTENGEE